MTEKANSRNKAATTSTEAINGGNLGIDVDVKVGILHTVANAIYATPVHKIREAVANARDNEAKWIVIIADRITNTLCFYDNGCGIRREWFKEIFKSIGYGMLSTEPTPKLSYFGIGLMSVFRLGDKVKLFTRSTDEQEMSVLEVDTKAIYDKTIKDKSISTLSKHFKLNRADEKMRETAFAPQLDEFIEKILGGKPQSFTEIVIEELNNEDLDIICDLGFLDELCKVLPLRVAPSEPFLMRFSGQMGKNIKSLLENDTYCSTIDVYFGVLGESLTESTEEDLVGEKYDNVIIEDIDQLWKYFPRFRSDLKFPDANVLFSKPDDGDFAYYIIHTVAEDLYRSTEETKENGFWVRNQNFLVKAADFLEKPGRKFRLIHVPLRNWIFGEIFHHNMNHFLTVSRTDYLFAEKDFLDFRKQIFGIVKPLNTLLRTIWREKKRIVECIVEPFAKIGEKGGALDRTEKKLRQLIGNDLNEKEFREKVFRKMNEKRNEEIEDKDAQVDKILRQNNETIFLGEEDQVYVQIDPAIRDRVSYCQVSWNANKEQVEVSISPNLFDPKKVTFLGESFDLIFVAKKESDPGVSINVDEKKIWVNPFNIELSQYSVSILDVMIALEVANALSHTQEELKKNFLSLIGVRSPQVYNYVAPLGDDLRRTLTLRSSGA